MTTSTGGSFDPRFQSVVDLFTQQANELPAGGASMAIYHRGQQVVNVWAGEATPGNPWNQDTISVIFSCTKGLMSILVNRLIEQGLIDPEALVTDYWPEFGQAGKDQVPVKWLLQHRAGLSAVRRDLTMDELLDTDLVLNELASQEPLWAPGTGYSYHALTFGHLAHKLIHSVTGLTAGEYFAQELAGPLGLDAYVGLPESAFGRLAPLVTDGKREAPSVPFAIGSPEYWMAKSMTFGNAFDHTVAGPNTGFNDPRVLKAELPGANGVMSAAAIAKIYSAAVTKTDGIRLLSDETIDRAIVPASTGASVWGEPGPWAARGLGFMLHTPGFREFSSARSFGHDGLGGQIGFGDLENQIGFAYVSSFLRSGETEQDGQQALVRELQKGLANLRD